MPNPARSARLRFDANDAVQKVIVEAATAFEERLQAALSKYDAVIASDARLIATERRIELEMHL